MALPGEVESLDALPEVLRDHYIKHEDGKFRPVVNAANGWAFENVGGLKTTLAKLKETEKALTGKLESFADLDPDLARTALQKLEEVQNWTPQDKVREKIEATTKQITDKFTRDLEAAKGQNQTLRAALDQRVRTARILEAVAKHRGNPHMLVPAIERMTKTVEENGNWDARVIAEDGSIRISMRPNTTEPMSIDELVEGMRKDPNWMAAFEGADASGSGSGNANGRYRAGSIPDNVSGMERVRMARAAGKT